MKKKKKRRKRKKKRNRRKVGNTQSVVNVVLNSAAVTPQSGP